MWFALQIIIVKCNNLTAPRLRSYTAKEEEMLGKHGGGEHGGGENELP